MKLFDKIKNIFKRSDARKNDYVDSKTGQTIKSSLEYGRNGERFLKLNDSSCALVLYPGGQVEVIFTKLYDANEQQITLEEETLMSLAIFMKQPGFLELLRHEFHTIAMKNVGTLTGDSINE